MNTKFKINSNNIEHYYPYMGMFTNNPNDIRSLQFLYFYSNNKHDEYIEERHDKKYLKYEYYELFKDAFQHLHNIKDYHLKLEHIQNYYFRKWYFDFIYSGVEDNDDFFTFPTLYPEKDIYQYVFPRDEIINKLRTFGTTTKIINDFINYGMEITDLESNKDDIVILKKLIDIYENRLEVYINHLDGYIDNKGDLIQFNLNRNIKPSPSKLIQTQFKTNMINSFDKPKPNLIIKINELLDNKYLQFAMLKEKNKHSPAPFLAAGKLLKFNLEDCIQTFLNIDQNTCSKMLINVLFKEKGYGKSSKEFFRNDKNFKIFDDNHMQNIQKISYIYNTLLDKLNFKIKEKKFYINDNIYDYFLERGDINEIKRVYKNTIEIEFKEPLLNRNVNDELILFYYKFDHNIPGKITKKINDNTFQITLNKTLVKNKIDLSNYIEKDDDYKIDENENVNENLNEDNKPRYIGTRDILIPKGYIYLKYYESVESWKRHQTIDPILNNSSNLLEYLNLYINTINKRILILNPIFLKIKEHIIKKQFLENFFCLKVEFELPRKFTNQKFCLEKS